MSASEDYESMKAAAQGRAPSEAEVRNAGDLFDRQIPPRGWLLGTTFCRQFMSSLLGTGGVGKTAIRLAQALSVATGRSFCGEYVHHRTRGLFLCFEDSIEELERRIKAAMILHEIDPEEVRSWFFYDVIRRKKILSDGAQGLRVVGGLGAWVQQKVEELDIGLVIFDPFVKTHGVNENDNSGIDEVVTILATLAGELDIAVDYLHHTRKGGREAGDADVGRGASAAKDAGRLVYTAIPMSEDDAKQFGIEEDAELCASLVRTDSAKVNIVPRANKARWFRLVNVPIGNKTAEYPNGDNVQAAEYWTPPDFWGQLPDDIVDRIFDRIAAGLDGGKRRYSATPQAKERSVMPVFAELAPELNKTQAYEAIRKWLQTGMLVNETYDDRRDRKPTTGLKVGTRKSCEL
jgi:hypothetical protein